MKTLYESLLDTDFDYNVPGENVPGSSQFMAIIQALVHGKKTSTTYYDHCFSTNKYLLKKLKNLLDKVAKKPVKDKPSKKWAVVCFDNKKVGKKRTSDMEKWDRERREDIHIYKLKDDNKYTPILTEYNFFAFGNLIEETDMTVRNVGYHSIGWRDPYKQRKYCIPAELCDLIDYIIQQA